MLRGLDDWLTTDPGEKRYRTGPYIDREDEPQPTCDFCDVPIFSGAVSLQGVGVFCSRHCATLGSERHELAMRKKGA